MHVLSHMLSVAWIRATSQRRSTSEDAHAYMLPQHNPTCIFILPDVSVNIWVARSKKYCGGEMHVHRTAELPFSIGSTGSKQQGKNLCWDFLSFQRHHQHTDVNSLASLMKYRLILPPTGRHHFHHQPLLLAATLMRTLSDINSDSVFKPERKKIILAHNFFFKKA